MQLAENELKTKTQCEIKMLPRLRDLRVLVVGLGMRSRGRQEPGQVRLEEQLPEGLTELPRHRAVQHKVDRSIQQRQEVHQLAEEIVAAFEEAPAEQAAHQSHDPLGKFRYQKQ